jgi:redox-sensitive bicupin YhaK (pirin superfamily)
MIENGDTQWMTAGSGILHIETPPEEQVMSGGLFHGVQLWVNLPARSRMIGPAYQGIEGAAVTLVASADAGALVRVIAGEVGEHRGPGSTHTPITLLHATVSPGAQLQLPWNPSFNALVYVLAGAGRVGSAGRPIHSGQLVVLGAGVCRAGDRTRGGAPVRGVALQLGAHHESRDRDHHGNDRNTGNHHAAQQIRLNGDAPRPEPLHHDGR